MWLTLAAVIGVMFLYYLTGRDLFLVGIVVAGALVLGLLYGLMSGRPTKN